MSSSNFYQRHTGPAQIKRSRAVIVDAPGTPPRLNVNPDKKPSELAKKSLKTFAIVVAVMIGLMYTSIKAIETYWNRRDQQRAQQTSEIIETSRGEPAAMLSTPSASPAGLPVIPSQVRPPVVEEIAKIVSDTTQPMTSIAGGSADDKFRWGKLLEERGELSGALDLYKESLTIKPDDPVVLSQAGRLLIRLGRHGEAVPKLREALTLLPENPDIMNDLGVALTFNNQSAEAVTIYNRLATNHPAYTPALFNHGYALVQLRDYAAARPLLEKYLESEPKNAMALGVLAILELAEKNYDKALGLLDQAIEISPSWPTPYLDAAGICAAKGDPARSVQYLERALEVASPAEVYQQFRSPSFDDVRNSEEGLALEKKIADRARQMAN